MHFIRSPSPNETGELVPESLLPRCKLTSCGGLLRPHVVWFHENLDSAVMKKAGKYTSFTRLVNAALKNYILLSRWGT